MPFEFGLWRIDGEERRISSSTLDKEERMESLLINDPNLLGRNLLILDNQVRTGSGNYIDLLGIDGEGDLHVIELKRHRSPRDVVAQLLDYASWVNSVDYDTVKELYESSEDTDESFEQAFDQKFNTPSEGGATGPAEVNKDHSLILVSSELDGTSERIIEYLSEEHDLPINAIRFNYFEDEGSEYIARTWLRDPESIDEEREDNREWNGVDFYANFGEGETRAWEDGREFGFIAGGQGEWYQHGMQQVYEGGRIFAYIPGRADAPTRGYVGVGIVTQEKTPVTEFEVELDGERKPILDCDLNANLGKNKDDPSMREYLIGVDWIETLPLEEAYRESEMYSNQNTVTKFKDQSTLEKLCDRFNVSRNYSPD
jgi:hypothetical protein